MGLLARALSVPVINRLSLRRLEKHFVAPDIYGRDDVADRQRKLARLVSCDIVPRLIRLHERAEADAGPSEAVIHGMAPSSSDVSGLADLVLGSDLEAAATYIIVLRDRGLSMETLFVELLEPTARFLGELWDRDECDFIDVTLGVARLQKLLAIFNNSYVAPTLDDRRCVLLAMAQGNQHSFGIKMVEKFLVAAGWQVALELSGTIESVVDTASQNWFAVAGFTAGSDHQIEGLTATIAELRQQSMNPAIGIMVGGPMFTADPGLASMVGADATAPNAPAAALVTQTLFEIKQQHIAVH